MVGNTSIYYRFVRRSCKTYFFAFRFDFLEIDKYKDHSNDRSLRSVSYTFL